MASMSWKLWRHTINEESLAMSIFLLVPKNHYLLKEVVNNRHVSSKWGSGEEELCILINLDM